MIVGSIVIITYTDYVIPFEIIYQLKIPSTACLTHRKSGKICRRKFRLLIYGIAYNCITRDLFIDSAGRCIANFSVLLQLDQSLRYINT